MDLHQVTVRLLLLDEQKRMLLVRKTATQMWHWPGGKIKVDEILTKALKREVKEETGLIVFKLKHLHTEELPLETIYCYTGVCRTKRWKKPDGKEIDKICRRSLRTAERIPLTGTQKLLLQNVKILSKFI